MIDYNINLLTDLIRYNKDRYLSYKNDLPFNKNIEFEKLLNARIQKVSRIKKRLIIFQTQYFY